MTPRSSARAGAALAYITVSTLATLTLAACGGTVAKTTAASAPAPDTTPAPPPRPRSLTVTTVETIRTDSGSVGVGITGGRTIVTLRCPFGTFVVSADSARVASWADSVGAAPDGGPWLLTATFERRPVTGRARAAPEALHLAPVAGPTTAAAGGPSVRYVVQATNGAWDGAIELDPAAAARLLAALQAHHGDSSLTTNWPFGIDRAPDVALESEVEKPVSMRPNNPAPPYPVDLRDSGVSGETVVQFVVDTTGRAELPSIRVLAYTRPEFARAARAVLPYYRFVPARVGGHLVKQIVQLPFQFSTR